jgi:release factor glutamine methyltransferase
LEKTWRIKELVEWTTRYFSDRGLHDSRLEAEILLAHVLDQDRVYLYANYDKPLNEDERASYRKLIKRRLNGEPSAYLIGKKEFMSLEFDINSDVLIPRPDTEVLVETVLEIAKQESIKTICDVGTGSGAIAVSLAVYLPSTYIYATEVSPAAIAVAKRNAQKHKVEIDFREGDLLEPLGAEASLDIIAANLPYLTAAMIEDADISVSKYEPRLALEASGDGLDIYRRLVPQALRSLRPGGVMICEIHPGQAAAALGMAGIFSNVEIRLDYANRPRLVVARRN